MTPRTPNDEHELRPQLRVLQGGLSQEPWQEDEPAAARAMLDRDLAAAARLCDQLEDEELQITFNMDTAGGRVRVCLVDRAGRAARDLSLAQVVSPLQLQMNTGVQR